ncbi:MAG: hypothetical protein QW366_02880 [Sulfolobales archaeon]
MAELSLRIEGIPEEKAEKLARLLELLIEKSDSIENLIRLVESLDRLGLTDIARTAEENSDFIFNATSRKEVISLVGNAMMLMYMLSNMNQAMLYEFAERMPKCVETGYKEFKNYPEKGMGLLEMLRIIRSPEFAALLKTMQQVIRCVKSK